MIANLSLRIGLGQVLTNNVLSLFVGDEIDASLDLDRAEYTANTLQALKNRISQILLITHKRPSADYISSWDVDRRGVSHGLYGPAARSARYLVIVKPRNCVHKELLRLNACCQYGRVNSGRAGATQQGHGAGRRPESFSLHQSSYRSHTRPCRSAPIARANVHRR